MRCVLPYAGLIALTLAAYGPVWGNDFVDFDDESYITRNPNVIQGLTRDSIGWAWTNLKGNYWQPLSWLSLQWDAHWFSERPVDGEPNLSAAAFHGQNLFWHAASACLLYGLWRRLTGKPGSSFMVAALFAVHPMHVESVAWATERKDVLSVFFGILTVWAYVRFLEAPAEGGAGKRYLATMAAYGASLLAKPMLITLPFVLLLLDYWPLRRMFGDDFSGTARAESAGGAIMRPVSLGRLLLEKAPLFLLAVGIGLVTLLALEQTGAAISLDALPFSVRLANALTAYGGYLASTFWPLNLSALYLHPHDNWSLQAALVGAGLLLAITALAFRQAGKRPWLIVGWLWFVGTLVPVIGLTQGGMQAWADRFSYWPHIGLFVALTFALGEGIEHWRIPALLCRTAAVLLLGCLGLLTWIQVGYWHDSVTLWERALAVDQANHRAHANLGKYALDRGRLDEARAHFARAVRLQPNLADYRHFLGVALISLGKTEEAAGRFRQALDLDAKNVDAWHNLGVARLRLGKTQEAIRCFHKVLDLQPESADARVGLALALWRDGMRSQAVQYFQAALDRNPREAEAWHGLGLACLVQGDLNKARTHFSQALRINPGLAKARSDLGVTLGRLNDGRQALAYHRAAAQLAHEQEKALAKMDGTVPAADVIDAIPLVVLYRCRLAFELHRLGESQAAALEYRAALARDADWPRKFTRQAWKLATHPDANVRDPRQAHELANQAIQAAAVRAANPTATMLDALAASQAALGLFQEAFQTAGRAVALASASGEPSLADAIRQRLQLYQKGKTFLDPIPKISVGTWICK